MEETGQFGYFKKSVLFRQAEVSQDDNILSGVASYTELYIYIHIYTLYIHERKVMYIVQ